MKINYCNIFILVSWLGLSACSQDNYVENNPTNKEEITFNYALDSHNELSRAYTSGQYHTGATVMSDLKGILVCVRNGHSGAPTSLIAQKWYPYEGIPNIIYWDDVSNNEYDVRKEGVTVNIWAAKLAGREKGSGSGQVNVSDAGVLTWTIDADQKTNGIDNNDLLAADYQSGYKASTAQVPLCFHHAMTKITVNIKKKETDSGFTDEEITNAPSVTLKSFYKEANVDLTKKKAKNETGDETGFVTPNTDGPEKKVDFTMHPTTIAGGYLVSFDAIVAPGKTISVNDQIGTIVVQNINGLTNEYKLNATQDLVNKWAGSDSNVGSVTLQYGVNYIVNAKLSKQEITFDAKVVAWDEKTGEGEAKINFNANVISHTGTTGDAITTDGAAFTLWRRTPDTNNDSFDENSTTADVIDPATTCTYSSSTSNWSNSPIIYWPNGSTNYYFRALCKYDGSNYHSFTGEDINHNSLDNLMVYKGTDLLWGTTAAHNGHVDDSPIDITEFSEGAPIRPRTGTVPLVFKHAMSKVTFKLETSSEAAAQVDFRGAELRLFYMKVGGTVNLSNGDIAANDFVEDVAYYTKENTATGPLTSVTITNGYCFIPQDFEHNDNTVIQIKLKDGTTYSLKLNECKVQTGTDGEGKPIYGDAITQWERGTHYTYTIHLEKEAITFRALVKDWEEAKGSGNATLDWD